VPTDTLQSLSHSPARRFVVAAIGYSIGVFGLLKLSWVETHALLPLTQWQGRVGAATLGAPALPIDVTLACSGADALALCVGAILAYPATWRLRLGGAATGLALILILNSIRIGTLGRAAASPLLFEVLHVYVWPAFLILAIAGYVFAWMQLANRASLLAASSGQPRAVASRTLTGAFVLWAVVFVVLFVATSSLYLQSTTVLAVGALIARVAARALRELGIHATAAANILWTPKGGFEVTQECLSTPLIPLYFAAAMTYCTRWRSRVLAFAAAAPLFIALGIARLLVVALPAAVIGSPLFLIHAFYQILLAALVVCAAVAWRRGAVAWRRTIVACLTGALCAYVLAPVYAAVLSAGPIGTPFNDAQGAMASLPSFQLGLFVALAIATWTTAMWRVLLTGVGALVAVQVVAFVGLHMVVRLSDFTPQIRDVRAWAIAAPLAIVVIGLISHDRSRR
jgi:exosortase/archaeosortase family protein